MLVCMVSYDLSGLIRAQRDRKQAYIRRGSHLQVRRVGQERQVDALPGCSGAVVGGPQVVLDIPSPKVLLGFAAVRAGAGKLAEDLAQRLAHHICQHI